MSLIEHQPREHEVLCQRCCNTWTWNTDAICYLCKAVVKPHHDYTAVSGLPRPMDPTYNVPGDTPCVCGGIAWYHHWTGCDDCNECTGFVAADV